MLIALRIVIEHRIVRQIDSFELFPSLDLHSRHFDELTNFAYILLIWHLGDIEIYCLVQILVGKGVIID